MKKILSIVLVLLIAFQVVSFAQTTPNKAPDTLAVTLPTMPDMPEMPKIREEFLEISNWLKIPYLRPSREALLIYLDALNDYLREVTQVPIIIKPVKIEGMLAGDITFLGTSKVYVSDNKVYVTLYSNRFTMVDGKPYKILEVSVYDGDDGEKKQASVVFDVEGSPHFTSVTFTEDEFNGSSANVIVVLAPLSGDTEATITREYTVNFNWDKAGKINFIRPKDMTKVHWAFPPVVYNMTIGYFKGDTLGNFMPEDSITRGQFATVLGRIAGVDQKVYAGESYSDVDVSKYYAPYIKWAKENNLFHLEDPDIFKPDQPLNREEMAYVMYNFIMLEEIELEEVAFDGFSDVEMIEPWARDAVDYLAKRGVVKGYEGKFHPKKLFTRAQVAQVLYNIRAYIQLRPE